MTNKETHYVAGFLFNSREDALTENYSVALIRKARPEWQKGKWNAIGGHVEPGESSLDAMCREFLEETGVAVVHEWEHFCTLMGTTRTNFEDYRVDFFRAFSSDFLDEVYHYARGRNQSDEPVITCYVHQVLAPDSSFAGKLIPNLARLIPMALLPNPVVAPYVVHESVEYVK